MVKQKHCICFPAPQGVKSSVELQSVCSTQITNYNSVKFYRCKLNDPNKEKWSMHFYFALIYHPVVLLFLTLSTLTKAVPFYILRINP